METINLLLFVVFQCSLVFGSHEYICDENLLRKPYVKVYDTKLGDILLDEKPGFHDVGQMKNIYVCINGPAILYFTRQTYSGEFYDEARNTLGIHKCHFYNGDPGPTANEKADHLKAILLMGNEIDYTRPSIKVFTAPLLVDEKYGIYQNVTSVITLGAQNCEIFKGPFRQSIVINYLDPDTEFQMCRLPYQTIDRWSSSNEIETKKALNNTDDNMMVEGECSKTPELTSEYLEMFNTKKTSMDALKKEITALTAPLDKKGELVALKSKISQITNDVSPTDLTAWRKDLDAKQRELVALETQQLHYEISEELTAIKDEQNFDTADYIITSFIKSNIALLERFKKQRNDINSTYYDTDPADTFQMGKLLKQYKSVSNQIKTLDASITEAFKKVLAHMVSADASLKQAQLLLDLFPVAKTEAEKAVAAAAAGTKYTSDTLEQLKLARQSVPKLIEVDVAGNVTRPTPVPDTVPLAQEICVEFPRVGSEDTKYRPSPNIEKRGACYNEKGTKLFGCQLLKARLGQPGICALDEMDSDKDDNPLSTVLPPSAYLPQYMIDVLNLINEIYKKACNRIRPVFAGRINNLLQCYLIKNRAENNKTSADVTTPGRVKFWGKIITALESCRDEGHALKFGRYSPDVATYYLIKDNVFLDVPFLKEQAENEYGFNFAIDMSWKIFATVLGLCMPSYQPKIPLINTRFFTLYTEEFLQPIQDIWISEKDNNIFKRLMSYYYGVGGSETWVSYCMEASFLYSSDASFRPPRKLLVNSGTESNYFVTSKSKKNKSKSKKNKSKSKKK